ncbi:MAG: hypothetical protein U0175_05940 [Caldilineaceae bacterium]
MAAQNLLCRATQRWAHAWHSTQVIDIAARSVGPRSTPGAVVWCVHKLNAPNKRLVPTAHVQRKFSLGPAGGGTSAALGGFYKRPATSDLSSLSIVNLSRSAYSRATRLSSAVP